MNKKIKRKFLASFCALSSVGAIVKPAVENITYAAMDVEHEIISALRGIYPEVLADIIWKFKSEHGHIGKQSSPAMPGYDDVTTKTKLEKHIVDNLVDELKKKIELLPDIKLSPMGKREKKLEDFLTQLKNIGFDNEGGMFSSSYHVTTKTLAETVCAKIWEHEPNYYGEIERLLPICNEWTVTKDFDKVLTISMLDMSYNLVHTYLPYAGVALTGLAIGGGVLGVVTTIPGMGKAFGKEIISSHLRNKSQKKELKQNLSSGSKHVLRLSKLDDNAINTIITRMRNLVEQYTYTREMAGKIANQFVSDLLDKRANPGQNVGMILAYGPPGSGKTKIVRDCLQIIYDATGETGHKPLIISQSMIDENDKENSEANQAWGVLKKDVAGQKISSLSPFAAAVLSAEKYKDGLVYVLVDDADKFKEQVLRGLWDATDGGIIHINGVEIPLSKVIFVMTANSDMTGVMDSLGGKAAKSSSSAFTSRCLKYLIDAPKAENYKTKLAEMFSNLIAQYGNFNMSEETVDTLAKRCVTAEKGMRAINEIRRVTKAMLLSPSYDPDQEIVPVPEGKDGWIEQKKIKNYF